MLNRIEIGIEAGEEKADASNRVGPGVRAASGSRRAL
jgi:hypothetical protein